MRLNTADELQQFLEDLKAIHRFFKHNTAELAFFLALMTFLTVCSLMATLLAIISPALITLVAVCLILYTGYVVSLFHTNNQSQFDKYNNLLTLLLFFIIAVFLCIVAYPAVIPTVAMALLAASFFFTIVAVTLKSHPQPENRSLFNINNGVFLGIKQFLQNHPKFSLILLTALFLAVLLPPVIILMPTFNLILITIFTSFILASLITAIANHHTIFNNINNTFFKNNANNNNTSNINLGEQVTLGK